MLPAILYAPDSVNVHIFHLINNIQAPAFQKAMEIASVIGKYKMFPLYLILLVAWMAMRSQRLKPQGIEAYTAYIAQARRLVISLVLCYAVYLVWVFGVKHLLSLPRPFAILPEGTFFIKDSIRQAENPHVSMPSGHAAFAMLMLAALWQRLNLPGRIAGIALVLIIGISRVALGVHFPSDVAASWLISLIVTTLVLRYIAKYRPQQV